MSQKLAGVKGMNDILPAEAALWQRLEALAREVSRRFGYGEVRTPVLEETALFIRGVGEDSEAVGKQMYTFEDRGGRSLSLRPEGTAPAARAYVEHSVNNQEPVTRWFYIGPMFRYERMKTGRYRQFHQLGVEAYGAGEPTQDVEVMDLAVQVLTEAGLRDVSLKINSIGDDVCRPTYQKRLVDHFSASRDQLCEDCKQRLERNPLRILDCKNERCQALAKTAPSILEALCAACETHFAEVKRKLDVIGVGYQVDAGIVRGLDYYTRTAFELVTADPALGTASAVGGGGRYDKMIRSLGGPDVPAVGFALGLDRLVLLMSQREGNPGARGADLFIATAEASAQDEALKLASSLRKEGVAVDLDARGGSLKSQMKRADRSGARFTLVLGETELKERAGKLKRMAGGDPIPVAFADLAHTVRNG